MVSHDPRFYVSPLNSLPEVAEGTALPPKVMLRDLTLREGPQAAGVAFSPEDKVEIARTLDQAGFPQIEVGMDAEDREAIISMKQNGVKAQLIVLVPAFRPNWQQAIDTALDAGVEVIQVLLRSSDPQLKMLGLDREDTLALVEESVGYGVRMGAPQVVFSTSFATLADHGFLKQMHRAAADAGATYVCIADSTGVATPEAMAFLVRSVREQVDVPICVHVHNDFGMAVANVVAAVKAGAAIADVSVLGLGERAGNAPSEEVVVALEGLYGVDTGIRLDRLHSLAQTVSRLSGFPIASNKSVVGDDVFAQKLEMHVQVTSRDPRLYEPFAPDLVGHQRVLKLGSGSGPVAVKAKLSELGLTVPDDKLQELVGWVNREALARKRALADGEIEGEVKRIVRS